MACGQWAPSEREGPVGPVLLLAKMSAEAKGKNVNSAKLVGDLGCFVQAGIPGNGWQLFVGSALSTISKEVPNLRTPSVVRMLQGGQNSNENIGRLRTGFDSFPSGQHICTTSVVSITVCVSDGFP